MADVYLDFFILFVSFRDYFAVCCSHSNVVSVEFLSDFEESLLNLFFDLGLQLFLHILQFQILTLKVLQRMHFLRSPLDIVFLKPCWLRLQVIKVYPAPFINGTDRRQLSHHHPLLALLTIRLLIIAAPLISEGVSANIVLIVVECSRNISILM